MCKIRRKKRLNISDYKTFFANSRFIFFYSVFIFFLIISSNCSNLKIYTFEDVIDDFRVVRFEFDNLRLGKNDIKPSRILWVKQGDALNVKVDSVEVKREHIESMCDFTDDTESENCKICDYCNPPASFDGPPCFGIESIGYDKTFSILRDSGFVKTNSPELVRYLATYDLRDTCLSPQAGLLTFQPNQSGLYRVVPSEPEISFLNGETNGELKVHVVETNNSTTQQTAYQLNGRLINGVNYWSWTVPSDSFLWMENFSSNLRVTDIAVYRGICGDASAQGKQCAVPNEKVPVKPSSIRFLPGFQGTVTGHPQEPQHVCYSNSQITSNSFINLINCLQTQNGQAIARKVTPTYEVDPSFPFDKLTWFVEFNTNQGADADLEIPGNQAMPTDANLIIEFTIEAI